MERLEGAAAIVTGGGNGLGRAIVNRLRASGVNVLIADRDDDRARAVAGEQTAGGDAVAFHLDVTSAADFVGARNAAIDAFGRVDIVVNNVGASCIGDPESIPLDEWERIIDVNLLALVRSNAVFVPHLRVQARGHVVNVGSTAGLYTYAWNAMPYSATKAAVVAMSEALAAYLRPQGVGVTCVCPAGMTGTSMIDTMRVFDGATVQSVGLPPATADEVGALVVDAIRSNTFLVHSHPDVVGPLLVDRVNDPEGFVEGVAARLASAITPKDSSV